MKTIAQIQNDIDALHGIYKAYFEKVIKPKYSILNAYYVEQFMNSENQADVYRTDKAAWTFITHLAVCDGIHRTLLTHDAMEQLYSVMVDEINALKSLLNG